ncbi:hypothetical protein [Fulvivirga lutea]|uniref:Uncharacterized protein n=1 Tax=Fulvivirga lutea TaxID=2810512 RepID=A0A974WG52_9BACT|nr:hypothetical protein [Fulvivirga lutea]QSE97219.1 hypothetical protein JR347_16755 [Fulvivirga lutea]
MSKNKGKVDEKWQWIVVIISFPVFYYVYLEETQSREYSYDSAVFMSIVAGLMFFLTSSINHLCNVIFDKSRINWKITTVKFILAGLLSWLSIRIYGDKAIYVVGLPASFSLYIILGHFISYGWNKIKTHNKL